jgi:hypothetical protein
LLALGLGMAISKTWFADFEFVFWDQDFTPAELFLAIPVILYVAMNSSMWILVSVSVLATFWDVYHSGLQTFGFSRIYDRKAGNDPHAGRKLDWWLNHLLYAGPIIAGATTLDHVEDLEEYEDIGSMLFSGIPATMAGTQKYYAWIVIAAGTLFLAYYVYAYYRLHRSGYKISRQKVLLLTTTGFCSIYTWGFNSFGEAFFIMNVFHATQYFGIVWWSERRNMTTLFRLHRLRLAKPITLGLFLTIAFGYGYFVQAVDADINWLWSITLVVSIMHFWYDGFIWSVRKKQV